MHVIFLHLTNILQNERDKALKNQKTSPRYDFKYIFRPFQFLALTIPHFSSSHWHRVNQRKYFLQRDSTCPLFDSSILSNK